MKRDKRVRQYMNAIYLTTRTSGMGA